MSIDIDKAIARQPRGLVRLGDKMDSMTEIVGWTQFEVNNNNYLSADTFRVLLVVQGLPDSRDKNWFSSQTDMYVELLCGFPANIQSYSASDLTSWMVGQVDDIAFDPVAGTIEISGRDLTRVFIDTKTTQKWVNLTSSQIATQLAQAHGLNAEVTATTTKARYFYAIDHTNMADSRSEWDVLCYLAACEDFIVYVRGKTLYFGPPPDATVGTYQLEWRDGKNGGIASANVEHLQCTRALTVSRGIKVVVQSWNQQAQKSFRGQCQSTSSTTSSDDPQVYLRTRSNLTQEGVTDAAKKLYNQLVKHEMKITFEMPADDALDTNSVINLKGTGTAFDQLYYPDSINRLLSFDGAFSMQVSAKSHAPQSEVGAQ